MTIPRILIIAGSDSGGGAGWSSGGADGAFVASATQVETALQELVIVTGCPAWNGAV